MIWNLPNILTVLRLLAAPALAVMFLFFSRPYADWFALVLFVSAAITDWFDGYLARSWKQETKMGAMLDPIADKAMVVIALMILVGYSTSHWTAWLVLPATVILFREVFVSGLREYLGDTAGTLRPDDRHRDPVFPRDFRASSRYGWIWHGCADGAGCAQRYD